MLQALDAVVASNLAGKSNTSASTKWINSSNPDMEPAYPYPSQRIRWAKM